MRRVIQVLALAATALAASPTCAQTAREWLILCANTQQAFTPRDVIEACTHLLELPGTTEESRPGLLVRRGWGYVAAGDSTSAFADFDQAVLIADRRQRVSVLNERARAHMDAREYPAAIRDYDVAARLAPSVAELQNNVCWARALAGIELKLAKRACDRALKIRPGNASFLDSRALVALKSERFDDAWSDYDAALRWQPAEARFRYGRGIAALRLGRTEEGRADLETATAQDPAVAATFAGYGVTP